MKKFISKVLVFMMVASIVPMLPNTVSTYATTNIPIDEAHFPDGSFRSYLLDYKDTNKDGYLDNEELSIEELSPDTEGIANLTGIEYFTNLKTLDVYQNRLKTLPPLPSGLKKLNCSFNYLESLPELPSGLEILNCDKNQLTSLPALPSSLKELYCTSNPLVALPELPSNLEAFGYGYYAEMKEFPKLPTSLEYLYMRDKGISGVVDLSQFPNLEYVDLRNNDITGVILNPTAKYETILLNGNIMKSTADIIGRSDIIWDAEEISDFRFYRQRDPNCVHNWEYETITKAEFYRAGTKEGTCTLCQETIIQPIPAAFSPVIIAQTFNNKNKTPKIKVVDAEGKTLSSKAIFAQKSRKSVGKYKVTLELTGADYRGSYEIYFNIIPKGVSISKLTAGKKALTVKWKKPSSTYRKQMTGYQIQYSTSSDMSKAKTVTVKGTKATSKKISKLKAKKTYYVKLRTYKTVKGEKYYSDWSKIKKVKTR